MQEQYITRTSVCGTTLLVAFAVAGCSTAASLPGTSLGTYSVVGTLLSNTCGSGVGASNPWDFSLEFSKDGSTLYLAKTDGSNEMSGTLSSTSATLTSVVTSNVDATDAGAGLCNLTQSVTFTVTFDSLTSPKRFTGSASYAYSVATGVSSTTNCTDQLSSSGGKYSTLPCSLSYSLVGTKQ